MHFKHYQTEAAKTAVYPEDVSVTYPVLGLASEAGEVAGKLKKIMRGDDNGNRHLDDDKVKAISAELGDCLWYIAAVCTDLGIDMGHVAWHNIHKLQDRQEAGTIKGDGDNR